MIIIFSGCPDGTAQIWHCATCHSYLPGTTGPVDPEMTGTFCNNYYMIGRLKVPAARKSQVLALEYHAPKAKTHADPVLTLSIMASIIAKKLFLG